MLNVSSIQIVRMLSTDKKHFIFLIAILPAENSLIDVINVILVSVKIEFYADSFCSINLPYRPFSEILNK